VHLKVPFFTSVDKIQTSRSVYSLPEMDVYTNDNQKVTIDISVIYQIPSNAVLKLLYGTGRAGNADVDSIILPVIRDRALAAFAKHNTLSISDERQQIADQMEKDVGGALSSIFGINVIDVQLTNISYSGPFTTAVEEAVKAKAASVQAENAVSQKKYEGEQKTVTADAEAKAEVARASGAAQATVLAADAQAKAIATVGAALKANPEYAHFYGIQRWNGVMPAVVGGGSSFLVDPSRYLGSTAEASAK
jgi:regulator of protease activity HflC (stomatin/prohibitin superfamily)